MKINKQKTILGLLSLTLLVIALRMAFNSDEENLIKDNEKNALENGRSLKSTSGNVPGNPPPPPGVSLKDMEKHREAREKRMDEELDKYFSLKTKEEKNKYLDEMIAERKKRMEERNAAGKDDKGPAGAPPPDQRNGKGPSAQDMKKHLESTSPEKRAKMIQFMSEMRARESAVK